MTNIPGGERNGGNGAPSPVEERAGAGYDVAGADNTTRIIRRRRGTILGLTLLAGLTGYAISSAQAPVYQSQASLEVKDVNQDFLNGREVNPVAETDSRFGSQNDVQTQIRILQSPGLLQKAADSIGLKPPAGATAQQREAWLQDLVDQVRVRIAGETRIVEVVADAAQPQTAADLANALCNVYMAQNIATRSAVAEQTTAGLNGQLAEMREKLEQSESALQEYTHQAKLLMTGDHDNVDEDKLKAINDEVARAQADLAAKESRWEMAQRVPPDSVPEVLDDNEYREISTKLAELKSQEAQLDATYQPDFRKNTQVHAAVVSLEAAVLAKRTALVDRLHSEYLAAQGRAQRLDRQYASQARLVTRDLDNSVHYNQLRRDVEANQQLYQTLVQKVKESSVASTIPPANVRIIDSAHPAPKPYKPRTPLNTLVSLVAGLVFAVALVLLQERNNTTIREAGIAPLLLQVPELGVIPRTAGAKFWQRRRFPTSLAEEGYRGAATSLLFAAGSQSAVLVVTSGAADEGKTTVCCGLGKALAERGTRVLIVDADLRRPTLHQKFKEFQHRNDFGLIQYLDQSIAEPRVHATETKGLSILLSGGISTADATLCGSPRMAELVASLRPNYDIILIDTPPLLGLPSARILGKLADGVILVLRAGRTTRTAALAACERLADDEITITGTILTDLNPRFSPDGPYARGTYR